MFFSLLLLLPISGGAGALDKQGLACVCVCFLKLASLSLSLSLTLMRSRREREREQSSNFVQEKERNFGAAFDGVPVGRKRLII
jgi:hypothetical protein